MLIKREKSIIDWDVLEFKSIERATFDFKYLRIDNKMNNINIQDGIFEQIKVQEISSEMLQKIICDIDKIKIIDVATIIFLKFMFISSLLSVSHYFLFAFIKV